jgi:hypothetical protein
LIMFTTFLLASAATSTGFPCNRLNWGWRNAWSTCSIWSYWPVSTTQFPGTGGLENPTTFPNQIRVISTASPSANPSLSVLAPAANSIVPDPNGGFVFAPVGSSTIPSFLCNAAPNTGTGSTTNLRNRCRRALDAYSNLVTLCARPPLTAGARGPNNFAPDWAPAAGHQPHVDNVKGLTINYQFCLLPTGTVGAPSALATPSSQCPGLLGWFTVVFNACGFNSPNVPYLSSPTQPAQVPNFFPQAYTPSGGSSTPSQVSVSTSFLQGGSTPNQAGIICGAPSQSANLAGSPGGTYAFKTSRCRKALDQFGRTASRCNAAWPGAANPQTPSAPVYAAGGWADPLRILATGNSGYSGANTPSGWNLWVPVCN